MLVALGAVFVCLPLRNALFFYLPPAVGLLFHNPRRVQYSDYLSATKEHIIFSRENILKSIVDRNQTVSFRPDKAINITKPGFMQYIGRLAASVGKKELVSAQEVCGALVERLVFFKKMGCRTSDYGLDYIPFRPCTMEQADAAFRKAMVREQLTLEEDEDYQATILLALGRAYHRLDVAMPATLLSPVQHKRADIPEYWL